jgi:hypothetical protein
MKLIEKWREAWKLSSVQWAVLLAVSNALFALLPMLSESVPIWLYAIIMSVGNIASVLLRMVAQPSLLNPS